jgi:cobalt/nickel transport system ATP-binding protein
MRPELNVDRKMNMRANHTLFDLEQVCFSYPGGANIIDGLDFTLRQGDRIGLLGPNGCGKTTFFHLIMGLLKPTAGTITIFGQPVPAQKDFSEVYRRIGLLFQDSDDQLFSPTVIEDVAFGPLNMGQSKTNAISVARDTLAYLGLKGFENRITHKLSGGEKRLVALATVLAMSPEVLLLDEPSTGLDEKTKAKLVAVLNDLDLSYVIISHESEFMLEVTNAIYLMENGRIDTARDLRHHVHDHPHIHPHAHHDRHSQ